ncbi:MAG: hypothetical protein ACI93R_003335 [Flavobacteriales bacterium]|jgi:hypothetical protein
MFTFRLGKVASITALMVMPLSSVVLAEDKEFDGCYDVVRGSYEVSKAIFSIDGVDSGREIGNYRLAMKKDKPDSGEYGGANVVILSGQLLGHPFDMEDGKIITRHIMGTNNRIGTITSNIGEFNILEASCPDASGAPQYAKATETMFFESAIGTGAFKNIMSGYIEWEGVVNGCDNPSNRVGDFSVSHGQLCFSK